MLSFETVRLNCDAFVHAAAELGRIQHQYVPYVLTYRESSTASDNSYIYYANGATVKDRL